MAAHCADLIRLLAAAPSSDGAQPATLGGGSHLVLWVSAALSAHSGTLPQPPHSVALLSLARACAGDPDLNLATARLLSSLLVQHLQTAPAATGEAHAAQQALSGGGWAFGPHPSPPALSSPRAQDAAAAALKPLLALLKAQRTDAEVQVAGCDALARYARAGAVAIAHAGGVKTLLFAMRQHIKKEEARTARALAGTRRPLPRTARRCKSPPCARCARLCAAKGAARREQRAQPARAPAPARRRRPPPLRACQAVVAANGVAMLAAVMKRHESRSSVQSNGCFALGALSACPEGLHALAKATDGVEAVVGSLRSCAADQDALACGKAALLRLVEADSALRVRVERANGSKFIAR
jgi:hypothetical protein